MDILVSVILPLGLAFIMLSLGVGLTIADFVRVGQRPLAFCVGALNQVILLPVIAYAVILLFGIGAELAVGIMILSACPGGVTSNVVTRLARGDVALSVTLTAVISLASVITVPIILMLAMNAFMGEAAPEVDITATAITMFAITVVPLSMGLVLRALFPNAMMSAEPVLAKIAIALFVVIVLAAITANWQLFIDNLALIGAALVTLLVVLSAMGYFVPRLLGRSRTEAKTISVETGIQNGTLGIAVAALIVGDGSGIGAYAIPSAVYGPLMYLIILPVLFIYRRLD